MNDGKLEELIVTKGVPVVRKLAKQFAASNDVGYDESDFMSLGQVALMHVAKGYEEVRAVQFTTYIFPHVRGAMQDAVRRKRREITVYGLIAREIECETRRFSSHQSDEFEILFDPVETIRARLHANLSDLAVAQVVRVVAAALRLMRLGTEDHLGELQEHALVTDIITRTIETMPARLKNLWQIHYIEDRPLKEYAAAEGLSDATAGRDHKTLRDLLKEALLAQGVVGLPDVE